MVTINGRKQTTSCGTLTWRLNDGVCECLLIKQFKHKETWGVPKGHMNNGETPEQTAIRETMEETGVAVLPSDRLPSVVVHLKKEDKTIITFIATTTNSSEPNVSDPDSEVVDARWFPIHALPPIVSYQQQIIHIGLELIKEHAAKSLTEGMLEFIFTYAASVNDWAIVKRELLKLLPPSARNIISARDPVTKEMNISAFERTLIERWSKLTGRDTIIPD